MSAGTIIKVENIADLIGIICKGQILKEVSLNDIQKDFPAGLEEYFFEAVKGGEVQ